MNPFSPRFAHFPSWQLVFLLLVLPATAANTWTQSWDVSSEIPDYDDVGISDIRVLSGTRITNIQSVNVSLEIAGGWNGDLYAHLMHDSGFSVLLNRVGRTTLNPNGSGSSGFSILLGDSLGSDIHAAVPSSGFVSGSFAPDGREIDPWVVIDTDSRTALLSSFFDESAEGSWTLFLADQASGATSTLEGWGLSVTGTYSPGVEVEASGLAVGSIFEWELATEPTDTAGGTRGINYGAVDVTGGSLTGSNAVFKIALDGDQTFAAPFWETTRIWTDIFKDGGGNNLAFQSIFSSFSYFNQSGAVNPAGYGSFSISGSNLQWTAVPEIGQPLVGLLLLAGLSARRRHPGEHH